MKKIFLILMFLIFSFSFSKIDVKISKNEIIPYENIKLDIIFENEEPIQYDFSGIKDEFKILGTRKNREYQIINMKKTIKIVNSYILEPLKTGNFNIKIKFENGDVKEFNIKVKNAPVLPDNQKKIIENKNVSFLINPLKNTYYIGEYIPYTESVVYFPQEVILKKLIEAQIDGFKDKILVPNADGERDSEVITIDGKEAVKLTVYKAILTPLSTGEKNIRGFGVKYISGNDFYYDKYLTLLPQNKKIEILPLPSNTPKGFKNVVGEIKVDYSLNKTETEVSSPVILNIKIYGEGNLKDISNLYPEEVEGATIYQTEKSYFEKIIDDKYYNEKNIEVAILPKESGEIKIPEIRIPYFNVKNKKYEFLTLKSLTLKVKGQKNVDNLLKSPINKINEKNNNTSKIEKISIENLEIGNEKINPLFKILTVIFGILSIFEFLIIIYLYRLNIKKEKQKDRKR